MLHQFSRTELLIGAEGLEKLTHSKVAVFGVGGVGSYVVEALARSGVGHLVLVDFDEVALTNINRQLPALLSTVGQAKVDIMKKRIKDINPNCTVEAIHKFYEPEKTPELVQSGYSYIVDAIDTMAAKIDLIIQAISNNIPIASAMGAGNKLDPSQLTIADISKTHTCPMAKSVRTKLRAQGITSGLKVVFSTEKPITPLNPQLQEQDLRRSIPGSLVFVPAAMGMMLASIVVRELVNI